MESNTKLLQEQLDNQRQKVDVDHFDLTLREVVRMATHRVNSMEEKELNIAPIYQRKFRWSVEDESRLIESIFLGLPVPPLFVAANKDGTWEVVDGLQRVSTLIHYVNSDRDSLDIIGKDNPLRLKGLEKLASYNGKTFEDLPLPLRLSFEKRMIRITTLSDKSNPDVRYDLFERLNTGGISLTPQEVRACIFRSEFIDFLSELAEDESYNSLLKLQRGNKSDGTKEEIVLKFFAYKNNRENFTGNVKEFLNHYTQERRNEVEIDGARRLFRTVCQELSDIVDGPFLRQNVATTPINQLEAVLVAAGELLEKDDDNKLKPNENWIEDAELVHFSTGGTNTRRMLEGRIVRAKKLLQGAPVKDEFQEE